MQEITESQIVSEILLQGSSCAVYFFTPLCGTCKIGERMLSILLEMDQKLPIRKCNVNFAPKLATELQIESVPCLILFQDGKAIQKEYAMRSVDYLYQVLQQIR